MLFCFPGHSRSGALPHHHHRLLPRRHGLHPYVWHHQRGVLQRCPGLVCDWLICFTWQECKLTPRSFTCEREVWVGDWSCSVWIISSRMERDVEILWIDRQRRWSGSISVLIVLTVHSFSFCRRTGCCRDHYLLSFLSPAGTFTLPFLCNEVTLNVLKKKFIQIQFNQHVLFF